MDLNRKLYRSTKNNMICGVCGGLGDYLGMDPTLIRLIWAVLTFAGGLNIIAYIIAAIIIPQDTNVY